MDLAAHVISAGWASGVNAYLTVAMLSLLGRSGAVEVPDQLESDPILYGYWCCSRWSSSPTRSRTWTTSGTRARRSSGRRSAARSASRSRARPAWTTSTRLSGGTAGGCPASHAVKAGLRLGINASPEPVSNIIASVTEDGWWPRSGVLARAAGDRRAAIALLLLAGGITLVADLDRIRRTLIRLMKRPATALHPADRRWIALARSMTRADARRATIAKIRAHYANLGSHSMSSGPPDRARRRPRPRRPRAGMTGEEATRRCGRPSSRRRPRTTTRRTRRP